MNKIDANTPRINSVIITRNRQHISVEFSDKTVHTYSARKLKDIPRGKRTPRPV